MKHMRHWLMMVMLLCGITANAHDFEIDGIYYKITSSTNLTVAVTFRGDTYSSYTNEYSGDVIIPDAVLYDDKTYYVTSILSNAFRGCEELTDVKMSTQISSIGEAAFDYCISLDSIVIPEGVTSIGRNAFCACTSLTSVVFPSTLSEIKEQTFNSCNSLESISIPPTITSIDLFAFLYCYNLKTLIIEDGNSALDIRYYNREAHTNPFNDCPLDSIYLGRDLNCVSGPSAKRPFTGKTQLRSVVIGDSVTNIGDYAFDGCTSLSSIMFGKGLTSIGQSAFNGCSSLDSIVIPEGVKSIAASLFCACTNLTSVVLPPNLKSIGTQAFNCCYALSSITIPSSVTSIGYESFMACKSLKTLVFEDGSNTLFLSYYGGSYSNLDSFNDCPLDSLYLGRNLSYGNSSTDALLFRNKTQLRSVVIGDSVTNIGDYAFDGCTSLSFLSIGSNVASIGENAFNNCGALSVIECDAPDCPKLNNSFSNYSALLYVPTGFIEQYQQADGWKDFNILPLLSNRLNVSFPVEHYNGMYLELTDSHNKLLSRVLISQGASIALYLPDEDDNTFNVYLKNKYGKVLGVIENIMPTGENMTVSFDVLLQPKSIAINVCTPDGTDVTENSIVTWYDENANYLCRDTILNGQVEDTKVKYSVKLSKELAMQYKQPEQATYMVKPSGNEIKVVLEPFSTVEIMGTVRDSVTGTPISDAMVTFSQKLNGEYAHITRAETDSKGAFKATLYDVPAEVTVAAADYISYTMSLDILTEATALGDILMKPISGVVVSTGFTYRTSVSDGDTPDILDWYSDYANVKYGIMNKTTGLPISNFSVQYPQLVLLDGVSAGDELLLTVVSRTGSFEPTQTAVVVDSALQCDATFDIVELGGIEASYTTTTNSAVVGILYNEIGEMVQKRSYSSGSLTLDNLRDGSYTLVTMGSSDYFNAIYNLAQLSAVGLVEGTDYMKHAVKVESGVVSVVEMESVPTFDESKLYYTDGDTRFTVNKTSITAGNYLTLTGKIDFKEEYAAKVSGVSMVIDIPESAVFVDNSVMVGAAVAAYALEGNRLIIPLPNNYTERVRFCIIPTESGSYAPTAFAQFTVDGKEVLQPIGSAHYTIKDLSIDVPSTVAKTAIPVSGTAIGQSTIQIYDNDVLIGETTSLANGVWSTTCELHEPYNLSTHRIHAKVTTKLGLELISEAKECMYDMNAIQVSKVTMINVAHPANSLTPCEYVTVFDFLHPAKSIPAYWYWPDYPEFTFLIEFTDNDTTKVSNVVLWVETCNGNQVPLNAEYDDNKGLWVASGNFGSWTDYDIPANVSLDFDCKTEILGDRSEISDKQEDLSNIINETKTERDNLISEYSSIEEDDENIKTLQSLLCDENADEDEINRLLDVILGNSSSTIMLTDDEITALELEADKLILEWNNVHDSTLINQLLEDCFDEPSYDYKDEMSFSIPTSNGIKLCQKEILKNIDENNLMSEGYIKIELNDGSSLYYSFSENSIEIVDVLKNEKYSIVITELDNDLSRCAASRANFVGYLTCGTNAINTIKDVCSRVKGSSDNRRRMAEIASGLLDVKGELACYYEGLYTDLIGNIKNAYDAANEIINKDKEVYGDLKGVCEYKLNEIRKDIANLEEINSSYKHDLYILNGKENLTDAEKTLKATLESRIKEQELTLRELKKNRQEWFNKTQKYEKELEKITKKGNLITKHYIKIKNSIEGKLPAKLTNFTKLPTAVNVCGKIAGTCGVAIQVIGLYTSITEIGEDAKQWLEVMDMIDAKLPCEPDGDPLMEEIYNNAAWHIGQNFASLASDAASIVISTAGGVPGSPTWWVDMAVNVLLVPSRIFNNHASERDRNNYIGEIHSLNCKKNCGEPGMPPCPAPNPNDPNDPDDPKPNNPNPNNNNGGEHKSNNPNVGNVHDPSGYVYEGVSSNRLKGVTASCYYKETVEDIYGDQHENIVLWDAEQYAQENPLFTDENGMYRWDVPKGLWQVKFEKDGYETTYSEWLPVPPPQLEVNIPMMQYKQPEVVGVHAYKDGVEIEFDKYMRPATLNTDNIFVIQNGEKVVGEVIMLNEEVAYEDKSEKYASKVRFVFDQPITAKEITLTVTNSVKSYAGLQMQDVYTQTFAIEQEVEGIVADSLVSMFYGGEHTLTVKVLPAAAAAGKTLVVNSSSPMILGVDTDSIVLDDSGEVVITVSGELPGMGALSYSLVGYDYRASTLVEVVYNNTKMTANPTASIASGTTVAKGTEVTLVCSTEGAAIYYTLDGSCPCDDTAILYDGTPIVINANTELRIMAVAEGMYESDVVVYYYYIEGADVEEVTLPFAIDPTIVTGGFRVQGIETECTVAVYGVGGELVMQREHVKNNTFINIAHVPEGMYIVVVSKDDDTHKQRILKVK